MPPAATPQRNPRQATEEVVVSITGFAGDVSAKYFVESKILGEGHYGTVRRCQDKETKIWFVFVCYATPFYSFD